MRRILVLSVVLCATVRCLALQGTALALSGDCRAIELVDAATGARRTLLAADTFGVYARLWAPRFSPDGAHIVFCRNAVNADSLAIITIMHNDGSHITEVGRQFAEWTGMPMSWTSDDKLYWSEYWSDIYRLDLRTRMAEVVRTFTPRVSGAAVSLDGTRAAASYNDTVPGSGVAEVRAYDLAAGAERTLGGGVPGDDLARWRARDAQPQ
jgi:hypothetical protein